MSLDHPNEWTFKDSKVAEGFDDHVREQLPWYDLATRMVAHIGRNFLQPGSRGYDLGASTGNIGQALAETIEQRSIEWIPVEPAHEMAALYHGPGEPVQLGMEDASLVIEDASLIVAFLSLMFLTPEDQGRVIERAIGGLRPGGALIIFDKVDLDFSSPYLSRVVSRFTLSEKLDAGASPDAILRKELSLQGVQRPIKSSIVADFDQVFQVGEFKGWIHVR